MGDMQAHKLVIAEYVLYIITYINHVSCIIISILHYYYLILPCILHYFEKNVTIVLLWEGLYSFITYTIIKLNG